MLNRSAAILGWSIAVYLAVVLQSVFGERMPGVALPAFGAAVAAWAVAVLPPSRAVFCAALAGLASDAAGHDRIGLHLATFAVSAAVLSALGCPWRGRGWSAAVAACVLAAFDVWCSGLLGAAVGFDLRTPIQTGFAALETGASTGSVVLAVAGAAWLVRRIVNGDRSARPMKIGNRWTMLTE